MPIDARTSGGVYKVVSKILTADGSEIGKVVDSTGRIIYEASRLIAVTGVPPISFTKSIGKPLVSWDLLGNAQQTGTPSLDNIIMPTFCGVRTGNLFDFEQLKNAPSGTIGSITFSHVLTLQLKANTYYTMASNGTGSTNSTPADSYRSIYFNATAGESSINKNNPVTLLTDSTGVVRIGFFSERTNAQQYLNGEAQSWINEGSTALPYEPYGYKIPFNNHGDNLFDYSTITAGYRIVWTTGEPYADSTGVISDYIKVDKGTRYRYSSSVLDSMALLIGYNQNKEYLGVYNAVNGFAKSPSNRYDSFAIPSDSDCAYVKLMTYGTDPLNNTSMFSAGSTAKPYSPYFSETAPVYLGQTQTVRRVKKLVLTGEETDGRITTTGRYVTGLTNQLKGIAPICTHYRGSDTTYYARLQDGHVSVSIQTFLVIYDSRCTTIDEYREFFSSQYAAGTPVTIWYVLATPETAIVNEPLAKIGDYADELHSIDAAITIPTAKGNNTLTVDTDLQPSSMTIVYKGR